MPQSLLQLRCAGGAAPRTAHAAAPVRGQLRRHLARHARPAYRASACTRSPARHVDVSYRAIGRRDCSACSPSLADAHQPYERRARRACVRSCSPAHRSGQRRVQGRCAFRLGRKAASPASPMASRSTCRCSPGVQDDLSVQVALIHALLAGQPPNGISHVRQERDPRIRHTTRVGNETVHTPVGDVRDRHLPQPQGRTPAQHALLVRARVRLRARAGGAETQGRGGMDDERCCRCSRD